MTGETAGTRRDPGTSVIDLEPGDYLVRTGEVWARLPHGELAHVPVGPGDEPRWTLTEHDDGTITLDPSIRMHAAPGVAEWHGWLRAGTWVVA